MARAATSGRSDDNPETLVKRLQNYNVSSKPVIDLYKRFGKVHTICGDRDIGEIYEDTRRAMFPQVTCMMGPPASGSE